MASPGGLFGSGERVDRLRAAIRIVIVAGAYYGAAKVGLSLAFTTPSVTAIWPPTGIALAAVLLWGFRVWPGVALGAFLANAWTDVPLYTAAGIAVGNTLEAVVGAYLLTAVADFRPSLERVRDVLALVLFGGILSTTISATVGVSSLLAGNEVEIESAASVWRTWWLGDMGGDLVVAPALLVAVTHWPYRRLPGGLFEAGALALIVAGLSALAFTREIPIAFIVFPALIVAAIRFWQPGSVIACLIVAGFAVPLTEAGLGPFMNESPDNRLLLAQAFTGVATITSLILAALTAGRHHAETTLERIAGTLQESLMPTSPVAIPGVETAVEYRPAGEHQIVGGDFYDVHPVHGDRWAVVVGDVQGKGPTAAATTALARYTLRASAVHEDDPSRILQELNDAILRQTPGQSCTAVYVRIKADDRGADAALANGGHPPPLLLRADGQVETVGGHALVLGIEPDPSLAVSVFRLAVGDTLLLYTDGLTDAYAPDHVVTEAELASVLRSCSGLGPDEILERFRNALVGGHRGKPRDDILMLVVRVRGTRSAIL